MIHKTVVKKISDAILANFFSVAFHSPISFGRRFLHQASKNGINTPLTLIVQVGWVAEVEYWDGHKLRFLVAVAFVLESILAEASELFLNQAVPKSVWSYCEGGWHLRVEVGVVTREVLRSSKQPEIKVPDLNGDENDKFNRANAAPIP